MHRVDHLSTYGEFTEMCERAAGVRLLFETARTELRSHVQQHHAGRRAVSVTVEGDSGMVQASLSGPLDVHPFAALVADKRLDHPEAGKGVE